MTNIIPIVASNLVIGALAMAIALQSHWFVFTFVCFTALGVQQVMRWKGVI